MIEYFDSLLILNVWFLYFFNVLSFWFVMWFFKRVRSCFSLLGILVIKLNMRLRFGGNNIRKYGVKMIGKEVWENDWCSRI